MKKIFFILTVWMLSITASATQTKTDSVTYSDEVITYTDSVISKVNNTNFSLIDIPNQSDHLFNKEFFKNEEIMFATISIISVTAIIFGIALPIVIIFLILLFRYKNRKAKYELAHAALRAGKEIPENLFNQQMNSNNNLQKIGVKKAFLGLGLFIFLGAGTGSLGVASIGLLIMFIGLGQIVIYHLEHSTPKDNLYTHHATTCEERSTYEQKSTIYPEKEEASNSTAE